jgi:uncharacterized membrane protein YbhN (UPF0104 family)
MKRLLQAFVTLALIVALLWRVDWQQIAHEITRFPLWSVIVALIAIVLNLLVSTWKWSWALRLHELHYPFGYLWRVLCSGFFLNNFLPTAVGGDAYRIFRTLPEQGYRSRALSAVVIERAVGFLALIMLGCFGTWLLVGQFDIARVYFTLLLTFTGAGALAVLLLERGWLYGLSERWQNLRAVNAIHYDLGLLKDHRREWLALFECSVLFQTISIGIVFLLFTAADTDASLAQAALITAAVGFAAAVPISINGLGVMEGALVATAVSLGLDYDKAIIVAFMRRALSLGIAILCGLYLLQDRRIKSPEATRSAPPASLPKRPAS